MNENVYVLLQCNLSELVYEIGYGNITKALPFFLSFRKKYGYDKFGDPLNEFSAPMEMTVQICHTREELYEVDTHIKEMNIQIIE